MSKTEAGMVSRFVGFPLTRLVLGCAIVLVAVMATSTLMVSVVPPNSADGSLPLTILLTATPAVASLLAYAGFVRGLERRSVTELGRVGAIRELSSGIAIGAGMFLIVIALLWFLGYYRVVGVNDADAMIPILGLAIISGVLEEVLARGVIFRILEEWFGSYGAAIVSALVFGGLHFANPNATLFSVLSIAVSAGLLLAGAFAFTRRLWMPIGIHFAWNFTQGGIFGAAISGQPGQGLLRPMIEGPELITGGAFGPESSIFVIGLGIFVSWLLFRGAASAGNLRAQGWRVG